jgi:hypothetical protein
MPITLTRAGPPPAGPPRPLMPPPQPPGRNAPPPPRPAAQGDAIELAFWDSVKDSNDPAQFQAYLDAFPDGRFAPLAKLLMARSATPAQQVAPAPAPAPRLQVAAAVPAPSKAVAPEDIAFGRYHALVIGNDAYQHVTPLRSARRDAQAVAAALQADYGFEVELLLDATRYDIMAALSRLRTKLTENDNLLIFYAGHGILDQQAEIGYWLPVDAEADINANWIANHDLTANIRAMTARHVLVVADSCYSGTLLRDAGGAGLQSGQEQDAWLARLAEKRSRTVLTSGGVEPVLDSGGGDHSVFAKAFLEALAENPGVLDGHGLFSRLQRAVVVNADQTPAYADIRRAGHDGGDFLFVRR